MTTTKSKPDPKAVLTEIKGITDRLVETGLADDQNQAFERKGQQRRVYIKYNNMLGKSSFGAEDTYADVYHILVEARSFNIRMLDGALIQMSYEFKNGNLLTSRLAYLPHPDLASYQSDPDAYMSDSIYLDSMHPQAVVVPIRFDFDANPGVPQSVKHPVAHLTLGQYEHCRIASTGALMPSYFAEFVLRSFYNTASDALSSQIEVGSHRFNTTITEEELALVHFGVPVWKS